MATNPFTNLQKVVVIWIEDSEFPDNAKEKD